MSTFDSKAAADRRRTGWACFLAGIASGILLFFLSGTAPIAGGIAAVASVAALWIASRG